MSRMNGARCRLGFERRVDAAIYQTVLEGQNATQSSERGGWQRVTLCGLLKERDVRLLRRPKVMSKTAACATATTDLLLRLLAAALRVQAPLS